MKLQQPFRTAVIATLGVGVGMLIIMSVQSLSTILLYVGTALFLALGLDPAVSWLERKGLPRWAALLITFAVVLAVFAGIILIVIPVLIGQISQLATQIQGLVERIVKRVVEPSRRVQRVAARHLPGARRRQGVRLHLRLVQQPRLRPDRLGRRQHDPRHRRGHYRRFTGALIVLILTIYFAASTPNLKVAVAQLVPASKRARFVDLADQITASVGYYVMGQVTLGVINGVLSAIFLTIIQAPFPAVLAVIAFFFSLIPLVGTLTGSTIIVLVCLIPGLGSPRTALVALIYYAIYMQVEAYILSPRIMNRAVSVPGAVVVIAALAGGSLLGLLGALVAIPVAASILIIYRQVIVPRQNER